MRRSDKNKLKQDGRETIGERKKSMEIKKAESENLRIKIMETLDIEQKSGFEAVEKSALALISGFFGSGKTYLACCIAALWLKQGKINKVYITRPLYTDPQEQIGFIKGSVEEKMQLYVYPLIQNFEKILGKGEVEYYLQHGHIEMIPTAFIRGITVSKGELLICDESQNNSRSITKKIVSRIGNGSHVILIADYERQVDLKNKKESGIFDLLSFEHPFFAKVVLHKNHRHEIVEALVAHYDKIEEEEKTAREKK